MIVSIFIIKITKKTKFYLKLQLKNIKKQDF